MAAAMLMDAWGDDDSDHGTGETHTTGCERENSRFSCFLHFCATFTSDRGVTARNPSTTSNGARSESRLRTSQLDSRDETVIEQFIP